MMNKKFVSKSLYKYCDVSNFKFFVDILLNNQLYGAKYDELNDPFEGILFSRTVEMSESVAEQRQKLRDARKDYRICSLSEVHDDNLMWSHYANGHRGCGVEVVVKNDDNWNRVFCNCQEVRELGSGWRAFYPTDYMLNA